VEERGEGKSFMIAGMLVGGVGGPFFQIIKMKRNKQKKAQGVSRVRGCGGLFATSQGKRNFHGDWGGSDPRFGVKKKVGTFLIRMEKATCARVHKDSCKEEGTANPHS